MNKDKPTCIYFDTSSKGKGKRHNCYRACLIINKIKYRKRSHNFEYIVMWVAEMRAARGEGK